MGRKTKEKQEELLLKAEELSSILRKHYSQSGGVREESDFSPDSLMTPTMRECRAYWVRSPETWVTSTRSRRADRQRSDLIRYLFCVYPVPKFLESVWTSDDDREHRIDGQTHIDFSRWYLAVAQGNSLFKTCAKEILTKRETHWFLRAPNHFTVGRNMWWTRALCYCDSVGLADRTARSKLGDSDFTDEFLLSVMRFFVNNPIHLHEMDDLTDYLVAAREENPNMSMKGRTLKSVRRASEEWHRYIAKQNRYSEQVWEGRKVPKPDWRISYGKAEKRVAFAVRQITTGRELVQEGRAMRHCVGIYEKACVEGHSSIWTMKWKNALGVTYHGLTIEVDRHGRIVHARGYANRLPRPREQQVLRKWAVANELQPVSPE